MICKQAVLVHVGESGRHGWLLTPSPHTCNDKRLSSPPSQQKKHTCMNSLTWKQRQPQTHNPFDLTHTLTRTISSLSFTSAADPATPNHRKQLTVTVLVNLTCTMMRIRGRLVPNAKAGRPFFPRAASFFPASSPRPAVRPFHSYRFR